MAETKDDAEGPRKAADSRRGGKPLAGMGLDHGMSQVSLVETALSPLDYQPGTPLKHVSEFVYYDADRQRRKGVVTVKAPGGLSPTDELVLYGLLAITFADPRPMPELTATPHYLCRQLGLPIGGDHYERLRESVHRLGEVVYRNSAWWDRHKGQHRDVGFHFLSHDLPAAGEVRGDDQKREPWTILWDPLFFRLMDTSRGFVWFDFGTYRALRNPAARRGYLLLRKIFHHRETTPRFDMRAFATQQLGYSEALEPKSIRQKLKTLIATWQEQGIVDPASNPETFFERQGPGQWTLILRRGPNFADPAARPQRPTAHAADHPSYEILSQLQLTHGEIIEIQTRYRDNLVYVVRAAQIARAIQRNTGDPAGALRAFREFVDRIGTGQSDTTEEIGHDRSRRVYERRKQEAIEQWATALTETANGHAGQEEPIAAEAFRQAFAFPDFRTWLAGEDSGL